MKPFIFTLLGFWLIIHTIAREYHYSMVIHENGRLKTKVLMLKQMIDNHLNNYPSIKNSVDGKLLESVSK